MNTYQTSGCCTHKGSGSQRGLVVIELVITLPLIILIMFATAELGRAFFQYTTLTKAVEAGTRYYASDPSNPTAVATTQNLIACGSPNACSDADKILPGITVPAPSINGDHVVVSASYPFEPFLGGILPFVGKLSSYTMNVSHEMRAL